MTCEAMQLLKFSLQKAVRNSIYNNGNVVLHTRFIPAKYEDNTNEQGKPVGFTQAKRRRKT